MGYSPSHLTTPTNPPLCCPILILGVEVTENGPKLGEDFVQDILQLGQPVWIDFGHIVHNNDGICAEVQPGCVLQNIT